MSSPTAASKKPGYAKIVHTCRLAKQDGLNFAWIDTCCIDKSSSAELTESINSMFEWYKNAAVCYTFLADHPPNSALLACRWFTRGWTLQELLGPQRLEFFDMQWVHLGSKLSFADAIASITDIPVAVIRGDKALSNCSVAMRMAWSSSRKTTRVEDVAYCLLGIFNVHMPLIYGEGYAAFRRLQEEIVKRNNDLTILAWEVPERKTTDGEVIDLFAKSPAAFAQSFDIYPFKDDYFEFSVTNRGLLMPGNNRILRNLKMPGRGDRRIYGICLGYDKHGMVTIGFRKVGPDLFYRDGRVPLTALRNGFHQLQMFENVSSYHIIMDASAVERVQVSSFRKSAIYVPLNSQFELVAAAPEHLWDMTDRVFLRPMPYSWCRYPVVIAMCFENLDTSSQLVVLIDYAGDNPTCRVFEPKQYYGISETLFKLKNRYSSLPLSDLVLQEPDVLFMESYVDIKSGNGVSRISVSLEKGTVEGISTEIEMFTVSLRLVLCRTVPAGASPADSVDQSAEVQPRPAPPG
jgi:hypothetical protein